MERCLSTLDPLPVEGYTPEAQRLLSGGGSTFPHTVGYRRGELLRLRAHVATRMSMSGMQDKVSLVYKAGRLEVADKGGEYILKPRPVELPELTDDVPANEHVTMLIAERVFGIDVPPNGLVRLADGELAFLVKRFDRVDGEKVPQEDFSQLMGITPESHGANYKYDGSSYEEIGELVLDACPIDIEELYRRVVFCYAVSNGDAHLKNFSLYRPDDEHLETAVLTPAYDLLCTSLHFPNESRLAMPIFADEFETPSRAAHGFETGACFLELARRYRIADSRAT